MARAFAYGPATRVLASAPFCGAFGFSTLVSGLAQGAPVVCSPVFDAAASAREIREHAITHTYANNEALTGIMRAAAPGDLASARLFGFASFTPALDGMLDLARQQDVPLTGLYGSSELQALAAGQPTTPAGRCVGARCCRAARWSIQARVRARDPESGAVLPPGQSGEVEIRSPSLMLGYLDNPEATARAFTDDGYFKTGDLGYALSEQQFVFQARMGDSLRLAGFLVNPAEIEQVVESLPGVRACQVVGATRADKTVPYAFVLLQPGARADAAGWTAACKAVMAGFKVPAGFTALDAFPSIESANSVKIQKHRLREMAEALLAAAPDPNPPDRRPCPRPSSSHSPQPLYLQAAALFRSHIQNRSWRPGQQIPPLEALVETYGISRATIRQALGQLEQDGLIRRSRGSGTFVNAELPETPTLLIPRPGPRRSN